MDWHKELGKRTGFFALLIFALAAGCISDGGTEDSHGESLPSSPPAGTASLSLGQCQARGGAFPIPAEFMAGSLPPGFEPVPEDDLGLTSHLTAYGINCLTTQNLDDSSSLLIGWWPVNPPDEFKRPNVTRYFMTDGAYVDESPALDWFRALPFNHSLAAARVTFDSTAMASVGAGKTTAEDHDGAITIAWTYAGSPSAGTDEVWDLFVVGPGIPMELRGVIELTITASSSIGPGEATMDARAPGLSLAAQQSVGFATGLDDLTIQMACNPDCQLEQWQPA